MSPPKNREIINILKMAEKSIQVTMMSINNSLLQDKEEQNKVYGLDIIPLMTREDYENGLRACLEEFIYCFFGFSLMTSVVE